MQKTMTEGNEWKLILLFTLPLMAGNLLQQLYNTVDGIIVGNFVSENALAAVGTCSPLTLLFVAIALGMSNGAAVVVSQLFGARRLDEMKRSVATSLLLLFWMGLGFSVLGMLSAKWLLRSVLGVQGYLLDDAVLLLPGVRRRTALSVCLQYCLRHPAFVGDSRATLYFLLISSLCNVGLDLAAVLVFRLGVLGVALATVLSQLVSALVSLLYMFRRYPDLRFAKGEFRFDREKGRLILKMGIPSTLQQCVASLGHVAIQRVINAFDITAGYTAAMRIESFLLIPIQGFFMGMATFTGQNLGAGKLERIYRALRRTLVMSLIVIGCVIAVIYPLAPQLVTLFGVTGPSAAIAVTYLRFIVFAFLVFCVYFCVNGVLQGSGDVSFCAFNTFSGLAMKVIFVYIAAFLTPIGMRAIWWGSLASWAYSLILAVLRYRFGPWRSKAIVKPL